MRTVVVLLLACGLIAPDASGAQRKKPNTRNGAVEAAVLEANAINDPQALGPAEASMIRAQILLDRAHFSPGEIDGKGGPNFERAISAFQNARKIAVTGTLDEPTWTALNADTAHAVVPYRITEADAAGPFEPVPEDMLAKARLKRLGFANAGEALGEQFHIHPGLLRRMNPGKKLAVSEEILAPNVLTAPTGKAARVVVSRRGTVTAFAADGAVLAHYPASSGSGHDPLPLGDWKINGVAKNPPFHYNPDLFWDADPGHSKAKIAPGPNNPVGVVWIDLSKEHYGIHGTPEPSKVGHTQSHGCIRLTNWDASELASLVAPGLAAILTE